MPDQTPDPSDVSDLPVPRRLSTMPPRSRVGKWSDARARIYALAVSAADTDEPVLVFEGVPAEQKKALLRSYPQLEAYNFNVRNGKADLHVQYRTD